MAIGKRIKLFRNRKNLTQKQLGEQLGFLGRTSDVRMAQYESEARIPKQNLVKQMAGILGVNPHALTVPDIDTYIGFLHTLFALEDIYGFKITEKDGLICLYRDPLPLLTRSATCSGNGSNRQKNLKTAKSAGRNMTNGVTDTRNWTPASIGLRHLPKK